MRTAQPAHDLAPISIAAETRCRGVIALHRNVFLSLALLNFAERYLHWLYLKKSDFDLGRLDRRKLDLELAAFHKEEVSAC